VPWANLLRSGQSETQVISLFLSSPEFLAHTQTLTGAGTQDERFVKGLYQLLLHRNANGGEVAAWVSALPALGRQGVARAILSSAEFRASQFEGYFVALLHRPSAPADQTLLGSLVAGGADLFDVRVFFEAGPEFFANG
jgi:hypothetical protein